MTKAFNVRTDVDAPAAKPEETAEVVEQEAQPNANANAEVEEIQEQPPVQASEEVVASEEDAPVTPEAETPPAIEPIEEAPVVEEAPEEQKPDINPAQQELGALYDIINTDPDLRIGVLRRMKEKGWNMPKDLDEELSKAPVPEKKKREIPAAIRAEYQRLWASGDLTAAAEFWEENVTRAREEERISETMRKREAEENSKRTVAQQQAFVQARSKELSGEFEEAAKAFPSLWDKGRIKDKEVLKKYHALARHFSDGLRADNPDQPTAREILRWTLDRMGRLKGTKQAPVPVAQTVRTATGARPIVRNVAPMQKAPAPPPEGMVRKSFRVRSRNER